MARRIVKDYAAVAQHKIISGVQRIGYDAIDATLETPSRVSGQIKRVRESLGNQARFVGTTIIAKGLLRDHLYGQIWNKDTKETLTGDACDAYVVEQLLANEALRDRVEALTQNLLQPSPVSGDGANTSNGFVNIMAGVSTFWDELHVPIPIKLEHAVKMENMLLSIHAGLDKDLDPDIRKSMLSTLGCSKERLDELVPLSDYVVYENRVREGVRNEIAGELDLQGRELTEHEQILVDDLAMDRMATSKLHTDGVWTHEPTYEELYGYSAGELYAMFDEVGAQGVSEPTVSQGEETKDGVVTTLSCLATNGDLELTRDLTVEVVAYLKAQGVATDIQQVVWNQEADALSEDAPGKVSLQVYSATPLPEDTMAQLDRWLDIDRLVGEQISVDDPLWEEKLAPAMDVYQDILAGTIEENEAYLQELTAAMEDCDALLSQSFADAVEALSEGIAPAFGITEEDLAFAALYEQEQRDANYKM